MLERSLFVRNIPEIVRLKSRPSILANINNILSFQIILIFSFQSNQSIGEVESWLEEKRHLNIIANYEKSSRIMD